MNCGCAILVSITRVTGCTTAALLFHPIAGVIEKSFNRQCLLVILIVDVVVAVVVSAVVVVVVVFL